MKTLIKFNSTKIIHIDTKSNNEKNSEAVIRQLYPYSTQRA